MKRLSMLKRLFMLTALFMSGAAMWAVSTPAWAQLPPGGYGGDDDRDEGSSGHDHEGDDEFEEEDDDYDAPRRITGSIKTSTWNTRYTWTGTGSTVYRGTLRFYGEEGAYKTVDAADDPVTGELHDVRYTRSNGTHYISGEFSNNSGQGGSFRFTLDDDLQSFTGTWKHDDGAAGGRWNGTRRR